jgi:hypothetical protein
VLRLKEGDCVKFSMNVTHTERETGQTYNECHDPDYDSPQGPMVNTMFEGDLTSLSPIS